jgi:hypothetical protein
MAEMEWLAKLLFPNNPKMVRHRKLQGLYIVVLFVGIICAMVGVMMFLLSTKLRV